jgi:hypothetical protein
LIGPAHRGLCRRGPSGPEEDVPQVPPQRVCARSRRPASTAAPRRLARVCARCARAERGSAARRRRRLCGGINWARGDGLAPHLCTRTDGGKRRPHRIFNLGFASSTRANQAPSTTTIGPCALNAVACPATESAAPRRRLGEHCPRKGRGRVAACRAAQRHSAASLVRCWRRSTFRSTTHLARVSLPPADSRAGELALSSSLKTARRPARHWVTRAVAGNRTAAEWSEPA